ncbi:MAG: CoA transferase [Granulosicoccus sp.]|nr:CoA transferase [Granulosicoccus sp.]
MLPLDGLLVISIEQAVAAPLCTARLVSAGARVIKIERPEGDFARDYDKAARGESSYFTWLNQGKESICLDFKDTQGASVLWAMLGKADVLVQNLSPGSLDRAGFSTRRMHEANPRLIVCNISGYGSTGEVADKRAYDLLVQAESGLISVSGSPQAPGRIGVSVCDIGAGITAYGAVLEALLKRARTGQGEELSVSLFDVAAEWMAVPYVHAEYGTGAPLPAGLHHPSIAPYGAFACADHRLVLIAIQNEREWERLCTDVLCSEALLENPDYSSNNERVRHREALEEDITSVTCTLTSPEFQDRLRTSRIAYGAVNEAGDLKHHPATRMSGYTTAAGELLEFPAHPVLRHVADIAEPSRSPLVGEHTAALLEEFSGPP